MTAIPQPSNTTENAIYALHARKKAQEVERTYIGWSSIGGPCDRALWYQFRWAGAKPVEGRIARLFESGHLEEARVLKELRALGCKVWDRNADGSQFGVSSIGGHFRGHLDAVAEGLPEAPKTPHLVDVKTIKAKKFDELLKKGMKGMYPKYWAQAHGYMGHMNLERAMFIFVCKDDDRIHCERFPFEKAEFEKYEARAARIIKAAEPPLRIHEDPDYFECRFCDYRDVCHQGQVPQVNCRTCAHSTPEMDGDGRWSCAKRECDIAVEEKRSGCEMHRFIPILLESFAEPTDMVGDGVKYAMADGREFINGTPPLAFTSNEIRAAKDKRILVDEEVMQLRKQIPTTRITG
jgi:hypothetical protein